MKKYFLFLVIYLFIPSHMFAADILVTSSGAGTKDGSTWSNAAEWATVSFTRGNTYYLAGGTYGAKTLNTAISGADYITVKKAGTTQCALANAPAGCANQAAFNAAMTISTSYWIIDGGGTHTIPSKTSSDYGIKIGPPSNCSASGQHDLITTGTSDVTNIYVKYVEYQGCGSSYKYDCQGFIKSTPTTGVSAFYLQYNYIHDFSAAVTVRRWSASYIEGNYFKDNWYFGGTCNGECVSSDYDDGIIFRYNILENACNGTGCYSPGHGPGTGHVNQNDEIYGNVSFGSTGSAGFMVCGTDFECNNFKVYNNTISATGAWCHVTFGTTGTGNLVKNNIFYDCDKAVPIPAGSYTLDYNAYGSITTVNGFEGSSNVQTNIDSSYFTSTTNFRLTKNTTAGANLGAGYNTDMIGTTRTLWDRGAYEYQAAATSYRSWLPSGVVESK